MSTVDLNKCKSGQRLKSRHGVILTYVERIKGGYYQHLVRYPNGSFGSRTDDGFVYKNPSSRLPDDHDIVEVLPVKVKAIKKL
jgi:hypothetical protein